MGSRSLIRSISSSDPGVVEMDLKLENSDPVNELEDMDWSVEQEILLLYSLHGHKPVGAHKHFQMILIQEKLSNAMNKSISTKAIWKKLATFYDLEALDEAEAEADAANEVTIDFCLPEDEFGKLIENKINGRQIIKIEKMEPEEESTVDEYQIGKQVIDIKTEPDDSQIEVKTEEDLVHQKTSVKEGKKEVVKRGPKKKESTPIKESVAQRKDILKETTKKDITMSKETLKDSKRSFGKDDKKDETPKRTTQETKKDAKEDKKEQVSKLNKRESTDKKIVEQNKKDLEAKKNDQKKVSDISKPQRESTRPRSETPKQLRTETTTRKSEGKPTRAETPKNPSNSKLNRIEVLKKDASSDKKKEVDKKIEKSPEKTPDSVRGTKLRTREKKDELETPVSGSTKRERTKDSNSKVDAQDEPVAKRAKTPVITKPRPTRNSIEPQQKPASPAVNLNSPQKRRTRM